jgi:hypothetical protein
MDSSLQSANLTADELNKLTPTDHAETESGEEEHHIHMPNPSLWPFILGVAVLLTIAGLLALPDVPVLSIIAAPFVLVGMLGWALEDPMAPQKVEFISVPASAQSKLVLGQEVIDKNGAWVGEVRARFGNYMLADRGGLVVKPYYVPYSLISETDEGGVVHLSTTIEDLLARGLDRVPEDLYGVAPESGLSQVRGVPQFARGPLSPAQTGHYNYGPNYPGINTDASGSYEREYVVPNPRKYVGERRKVFATSRTIPARAISPE